MAIDTAAREAIRTRAEQGRRAGQSENERALAKDVDRLLAELEAVEAKRLTCEGKVSELELERNTLRDQLKGLEDD